MSTVTLTIDEAKAELQLAEDLLAAAELDVKNLKATVKALMDQAAAEDAKEAAGQDDLSLAQAQEGVAEGEVTAAKAKVTKAQEDLKNAQAAAQM